MKSIELKFNEALAAIDKAGKRKTFDEKAKHCTTIEAKFNAAEAVLKSAGIVREQEPSKPADKKTKVQENVQESEAVEDLEEVKRDFHFLFDVEPKPHTSTNKESVRSIKKNNGSVDNFVENNPFNDGRSSSFSPGYIKQSSEEMCAKGDKVMFDGLLKLGKITEAEHKKLTGAKPEGYTKLNEQQRKDFDFCRMSGLSEAQAFTFVNTKGFREVSR